RKRPARNPTSRRIRRTTRPSTWPTSFCAARRSTRPSRRTRRRRGRTKAQDHSGIARGGHGAAPLLFYPPFQRRGSPHVLRTSTDSRGFHAVTVDDLNAPLGTDKPKRRRFRIPALVPRAIAGALAACVLIFALWALLVDDPFGGEP